MGSTFIAIVVYSTAFVVEKECVVQK